MRGMSHDAALCITAADLAPTVATATIATAATIATINTA